MWKKLLKQFGAIQKSTRRKKPARSARPTSRAASRPASLTHPIKPIGDETSGVIHSKVRGVSHKNPDGTSRQAIIQQHVHPRQELIVKPEPNNPYGRNALGLWAGKFQIGYIGSNLSDELAAHLRAGGKLQIFVTDITGGEQETLGVNIQIEKR